MTSKKYSAGFEEFVKIKNYEFILIFTLLIFKPFITLLTNTTIAAIVYLLLTTFLLLYYVDLRKLISKKNIKWFALIILTFSLFINFKQPLVALNGLRFYVVPLLFVFIGYNLTFHFEAFRKYIIVLILLAIPFGFLTEFIYLGKIQHLDYRITGDPFGAFFGKSSGALGLFLVLCFWWVIYLLKKKYLSLKFSVIFIVLISLAVSLAEVKAFFYLVPLTFIPLLIVYKSWLNYKALLLSISVIILTVVFHDALYLGSKYESSILNFLFSQEATAHYVENKSYGRIFKLEYTYQQISNEGIKTLLLGNGIGTAVKNTSYVFNFTDFENIPEHGLHGIALAKLLYEIGILGSILVLSLLSLLIFFLLTPIIKLKQSIQFEFITFSSLVFILIFVISIIYNSAILTISLAAPFWLFQGQFFKQRFNNQTKVSDAV